MKAACDKQHGCKTNTGAKHEKFPLGVLSLNSQTEAAGPRITTRAPAAIRPRSEDLAGALQCLPYTPRQRDADKEPEQRGLEIQSAFADAERTVLDRSLALGASRLKLGNL